MKEIDCRGLNCPEPVLKTKTALEQQPSGNLKIIVDNQTARDNVLRFLRSKGLEPDTHEKDGIFHITAEELALNSKTGVPDPHNAATLDKQGRKGKPVLLISTDQLGVGSSELGKLLMRNFIYTLTRRDDMPYAIIFMNAGVKLSILNSPVLQELKELEENKVVIMVCGTCLDYYQLKDRHQAGQVSNMYDISDLLMLSERVVTI